jgi:hypothetical protein
LKLFWKGRTFAYLNNSLISSYWHLKSHRFTCSRSKWSPVPLFIAASAQPWTPLKAMMHKVPFSAPQTWPFKSKFLQTKQLDVLCQLKFKNKGTFEFSKHTLKEKLIFQLSINK